MSKNVEIMISVNPPYSQMISEEYKRVEFRKNSIIDLRKGDIVWFYETKNKGGSGSIIGYATIDAIVPLEAIYDPEQEVDCFVNNHKMFWNYCFDRDISVPYAPTNEWVYQVRECMKEEFFQHIAVIPFDYLTIIGFGGNYAIMFDKFVAESHALGDFISKKSNDIMARPPQNMCYVKLMSR